MDTFSFNKTTSTFQPFENSKPKTLPWHPPDQKVAWVRRGFSGGTESCVFLKVPNVFYHFSYSFVTVMYKVAVMEEFYNTSLYKQKYKYMYIFYVNTCNASNV